MLMETITACFLLISLGLFFSINLHNILVMHRSDDSVRSRAEIDTPSDFVVSVAALGTFAYFFEALSYPFLVLANLPSLLSVFTFSLPTTLAFSTQVLGLLLTAIGYFLFLWSIIVRGRYATSWAMRNNHKLVTWGPYRYVRHPSYLAYFFMFIGLFAIWPSWPPIVPLIAIPGYFRVTLREERLLEQHFGSQYLDYQRRTGRFIPKLWQKTHSGEERSR
ncbi:MAG: isoprenylcysteine carboxylmethyltransferase family protein [Candidatus Bathyarchaeia archaeon]